MPEIHEALNSGKPQKMLTNTGRFLHLQVSPITAKNNAARTGRVLMFRDVSDVEKAQKEIRSNEKLLRTLVDHSVNGIIRMRWIGENDEKSLRVIFANAAAGRYLETDPDKMNDLSASSVMELASSGMDRREAEDLQGQFLEAAENSEVIDTECRIGLN